MTGIRTHRHVDSCIRHLDRRFGHFVRRSEPLQMARIGIDTNFFTGWVAVFAGARAAPGAWLISAVADRLTMPAASAAALFRINPRRSMVIAFPLSLFGL